MDFKDIKLQKLSAIDELNLNTLTIQIFPFILARLGDYEGAYAIARNAALLCCAMKAEDSTLTPMLVLSRFGLEEIAALAKTYYQLHCEQLEWGINDSFEAQYKDGEGLV